MKIELMANTSLAAIVFTQDHGWMDNNIFLKYAKPTKKENILSNVGLVTRTLRQNSLPKIKVISSFLARRSHIIIKS